MPRIKIPNTIKVADKLPVVAIVGLQNFSTKKNLLISQFVFVIEPFLNYLLSD